MVFGLYRGAKSEEGGAVRPLNIKHDITNAERNDAPNVMQLWDVKNPNGPMG